MKTNLLFFAHTVFLNPYTNMERIGMETKNTFVVTAITSLLQSKNNSTSKTLDIPYALFVEEKLSFGIGIHITFTFAVFPKRNIILSRFPLPPLC